jgi:PKD repeat protein
MPIVGLERYIKTVLKMPSEGIKSELITRLNNMSGLSGTPMSPLLTKWIQSRIGLFAVQKIQNYVAGGFSPDELRRFNGVFPDTFEGMLIRAELYDALTGGGVIAPVANFSGSPTTLYAGNTVVFTDLSTNTPTSWSWAFTGGTPTTSTTQNPSIVYNTAGSYGVTLTATNSAGSDPETKPNYITVNATPLLDSYPSATVAYGMRRLRSAYTGSCIRVRRSSDNTELNIGFDSNNNLDQTSLTSFVGAGNGFVTKWYDQSTNGNDLIQTTAGTQPQIVFSGTVYTINGKPSLKYSSASQSSLLLTNTIASTSGWNCFVAMGRASTADIMASITNTSTVFPYASLMNNDNKIYITDTLSLGSFNFALTGLKLITTYYGAAIAYVNSALQTVSTSSSASGGVFQGVGRRSSTNSNGYISELIFYPTNQASRAAIETNMINYYSIT